MSPISIISTGQWTVTLCGWEGNRRSNIALAMRYRLQWSNQLRTQGLGKRDEHPYVHRSPLFTFLLDAENDFYPEFVIRDASVAVSPSAHRGDVVALLEARDADRDETCHGGDDCPCARLTYAVEAGDSVGLFAVDRSTGRVTVAGDLATHDGQTVKLYVSVVNEVVDVAGGSDVRGPKNYGSLTVVIGPSHLLDDVAVAEDSVHSRHKRVRQYLSPINIVTARLSDFHLYVYSPCREDQQR